MNRIAISAGLIAVIFLCLRPPYQQTQTARLPPHKTVSHTAHVGHYWIWNPPREIDARIASVHVSSVTVVNWPRLGAYIGLALIIIIIAAPIRAAIYRYLRRG